MKFQIFFLATLACVLLAVQGFPNEETPEAQNHETEHKTETEQKSEHPAADESDTCVPGETFKKDCNDCTCPPSGLKSAGACTLLACIDDGIQKD